ncbi:MAG: SMI1/KNR4 family protein [Acutalibacteraceae bacterium]|nr:SMI1/KNR4 family protein [Acutalibacteraceae bacterium]
MSKNIFIVISGLKNIHYLSPAREVKVMLAENHLGLSFADEYKKYVINYGAISGRDFKITGVCDSDSLSVEVVTQRVREKHSDFPSGMYVVEDGDKDNLFILQNHSGEVFSYIPGFPPQKIFDSLAEYLDDFYGGNEDV